MNKTTLTNCNFTITNFEQAKMKVLNWIQQFGTFCFLDNHQYQLTPHSQECLIGAGVRREFRVESGPALKEFQSFLDMQDTWLFGHLSYDLKNEIEELQSEHKSNIQFPDIYFFEPLVLLRLSENYLFIEAEDPESIFKEIESCSTMVRTKTRFPISIQNRFSKEDYIATVSQLKQHILRGDCYEINFCQEFFAESVNIEPVEVYKRLSAVSPNPYSALYRVEDQWLICASPERFLRKEGSKLLSQPIKGTSRRDLNNSKLDNVEKDNLYNSTKDRAENVMVVDLVRNDLAKVCVEGSVHVDELFGIYSFPQVHQMISTVSGTADPEISFTEIIRATFPMGSMTGAPKKRVMELIEQYERSRRGVFSGAVGYLDPKGDFDFNVVIRSILYNQKTGYLSFPAGSGITFYSEEEKEWQECLWKAEAIKKILEEGSD